MPGRYRFHSTRPAPWRRVGAASSVDRQSKGGMNLRRTTGRCFNVWRSAGTLNGSITLKRVDPVHARYRRRTGPRQRYQRHWAICGREPCRNRWQAPACRNSERWQRLENWGRARNASCSRAPDPRASDALYIGALAVPNTINTMPEDTLSHFADHGDIGSVLPRDGERASERCRRSQRRTLILMRWPLTSDPKAPSRSAGAGPIC
jgi:hypothetical protein